MNYYARVVIIILLLIGLAQVIPEAVNAFLVLVLVSMLVLQSGQFARLIGMLKL